MDNQQDKNAGKLSFSARIAKIKAVLLVLSVLLILSSCAPGANQGSKAVEGILNTPALTEATSEVTPSASELEASFEPTTEPTALPTATPNKTTAVPTPTPKKTAKPSATPKTSSAPSQNIILPEGKPLSGKTIGIDAGHQLKANYEQEPVAPGSSTMKAKVSTGTRGVSTKIYEYDLNLKVALKLQKKLESLGAKVVMTRTSHNVNISNSERAKMMNEKNVDAFIRIHANGNNNGSVHGMLIIVPSKDGYLKGTLQQKSEKLGSVLLDRAVKATGAKNGGLSFRNDQTGINWSKVPVCIIEMGYMTNEEEDKLLNTDSYQDKIVNGLASGFISYFG